MKKDVPKKVAEELWEQMVKFAEYCFNKSRLYGLWICHLPDRLPEGQLSRRVHGGPADRQQRRPGQGTDAHRQLHRHGY